MGRWGWGFYKKLQNEKNIFIARYFKKCSQPQPQSPNRPTHKKNKLYSIIHKQNNMQEPRRQSKRIAESGTGGVLETVKALLPKTRRAPAAAKKPAATNVEPEQPQLAREGWRE